MFLYFIAAIFVFGGELNAAILRGSEPDEAGAGAGPPVSVVRGGASIGVAALGDRIVAA